MKRTIEIEDNLQQYTDCAIQEVKEELEKFLKENPDTTETPDLGNDLDYSGRIHEIVDGSVPVYTADIEGLFYLYGNEFERAFDDAGIGEKEDKGWPNGWKAAAIYCYIEQHVAQWYHKNAPDIFDKWQDEKETA